MTWDWPNSTVQRCVDGDTVVVLLTRDLGFNGSAIFIQHLRLARINAAKLSTPHGREAKTYLESLLLKGAVDIETLKPYKYGDEWMAEITLPDGSNVSDLMVQAGHAVHWDGRGSKPSDD